MKIRNLRSRGFPTWTIGDVGEWGRSSKPVKAAVYATVRSHATPLRRNRGGQHAPCRPQAPIPASKARRRAARRSTGAPSGHPGAEKPPYEAYRACRNGPDRPLSGCSWIGP